MMTLFKKSVYLAINEIEKKWTMPIRNWAIVLNQFILYLITEFYCNYETSIIVYTKFWTVPEKAKNECAKNSGFSTFSCPKNGSM